MENGVAHRSPGKIVTLALLAVALGAVASFLFLLGMCLGDGVCATSVTAARPLALGGAVLGATGAGAAAAAAIRPRPAPVLAAAGVALAVMACAVTQIR